MPHDAGLPEPSGHLPPPHPVAGRIDPTPEPPSGSAAPPPALSATPDVVSLLQALRRRWVAAVLVGAPLAALAAGAAWHLLEPKHTAAAKLRVAYEDPRLFDQAKGTSPTDFRTLLLTTANEITSPPVIRAALKRDEVRHLNLEAREPDPAAYVAEGLNVDWKDNSELLTIKMSSADPAVATAVANAVQQAFLKEIYYARQTQRVKDVAAMETAFNQASEALKAKKDSLKDMVRAKDASDPARWAQDRADTLVALRDAQQRQDKVALELIKARSALDAFELQAKLRKNSPEGPAEKTVEELLEGDREAMDLRKRIRGLEERIAGFGAPDRETYPTVMAARDRIRAANQRLAEIRKELTAKVKKKASPKAADDATALVRDQLQKDLDALAELAKQVDARVAKLTEELGKVPEEPAGYGALVADIEREKRTVDELGTRLERKRVELGAAPRITAYQDAELTPKEAKKQLLATAVAPAAVLFAVCVALAWLDHRQRRIRSAGQVSRGLGIRVVGAVPARANLARELAAGDDPEGHPALESIDALRTLLLHEAGARDTRVVMVTSAMAGEGKTTLASHLASSLARAGRKTLLVDGDLRRPTAHELFELPVQPGFSEVLLGEVEVAEACQEVNRELSVLTAGQWDREVLQALARDGLQGVFEKLQEEFDFLVIDSHPVLAATDSLLLARQVDAVILSVLREVSQLPKVYAASQQLTALGVRVLGAVVNGTDPEDAFTSPAAVPAAA